MVEVSHDLANPPILIKSIPIQKENEIAPRWLKSIKKDKKYVLFVVLFNC